MSGIGRTRSITLAGLRGEVVHVEADIAQARAYGISGVPFFVFDGRLGVSGAQAPETFRQVLDRAVARAWRRGIDSEPASAAT